MARRLARFLAGFKSRGGRARTCREECGGVWVQSVAPAPVDGIDSVADEPQIVSDSTEPAKLSASVLSASVLSASASKTSVSKAIGAAMTSA